MATYPSESENDKRTLISFLAFSVVYTNKMKSICSPPKSMS